MNIENDPDLNQLFEILGYEKESDQSNFYLKIRIYVNDIEAIKDLKSEDMLMPWVEVGLIKIGSSLLSGSSTRGLLLLCFCFPILCFLPLYISQAFSNISSL